MSDRWDERTQRILIGIGLVAVGAFLLLSLTPLGWLGRGASQAFPSGNLVGPVGSTISRTLVGSFGAFAAATPLLPLLWGLWSLKSVERSRAARWTLFVGAVLLLLPPLTASVASLAGGGPAWLAGSYGRGAARLLGAGIGWVGSALLLLVIFVASSIATLGLAPLRTVARSVDAARSGGRRAVEAGGVLVRWSAGSAKRLTAAAAWIGMSWAKLAGRARSALARKRQPGYPPAEEPAELAAVGHRAGAATAEPEPPRPLSRRSGRRAVVAPPETTADEDLPPIDLLAPPPRQEYAVNGDVLNKLGVTLVDTLRTFKVEGTIGGRTTGPVVTQFEVVPASGVKVGKIAALADDLALALKAPSVRIIAPIPGKGAVGVEVPNPRRKVVYLREILESDAYATSKAELPLALGEDVRGRSEVYDLAHMPHLLIAGVTGSGKSVCINAIISSLVYRYVPERLRLLLIDPKMVELGGYNVLPHLRHPVVTDNSDAATVLKWLVYEMERRYAWLSVNGSRNLREFNRRIAKGLSIRAPGSEGGEEVSEPEILPYIVLIVDELADLMMTVQNEVERPLAYLAQKARATGIHLVVATQRPSVNVITGLIKANFPCRVAFRVASKVDSRTILDQNGAETLLGNGDMLFMPPGQAEPVRIQGTYVSTEDTERLMDWYRVRGAVAAAAAAKREDDIIDSVRQRELEEAELETVQEGLEDRDSLFRRAAEVVIQHQQGSTSLLQRRLKIGYGRAARIVDQLEQAGIVGPPEGSKPREVLVRLQDLDRICTTSGG